jgi:hypothetical protein
VGERQQECRVKEYRIALPRELLNQIRIKRRLYYRHRRNPLDSLLFEHYKQFRNSLNRKIREYKLITIKQEFNQIKSGSSEWWKTARRHFVGDSVDLQCPTVIETANQTFSKPTEIATAFAQHFATMYASSSLSGSISNGDSHCESAAQSLQSPYAFINDYHIRFIIDNLPSRKSNLDKIPNHVLKRVSIFIAYPLSVLIRQSLVTSSVPPCLKVSRVIPLHKCGPRQSVANYRPISLQSVFTTITEKVAIQIANAYVYSNNLVSVIQFGFKLHHSCIHACLYHLSAIYKYIETGMKVGCLYVDIRNAFPSVDHKILVETLRLHGNLGLSSGWFESYLSSRKMYVDVNNNHSELVSVTRGVPQGSIFGPLLFNIYYNNVVSKFKSSDITLFADDTAVVSAAADTTTLMQHLQQALMNIDMHLTSLNMELNAKKTLFLIIKGKDPTLNLSLRNSCINQCDTFKYLGIYIDHDLSWKTHVTKLIRKVQKMLYVLHRCSGKSNNDKRLLLFRTYIYPHFLYGIQLYMFCSVFTCQTRGIITTLLSFSNSRCWFSSTD